MDPATYQHLVEHHVQAHGGWVALADELSRRLRLSGQAAPDLDTAVKGLRRLAQRTAGSGGQYGRWLLRHFGVPDDTAERLRAIATYHHRFSDLPASIRLDQLRLWDRPPITESGLVVWVHVGLASVFHRSRMDHAAAQRIQAAQRQLGGASPEAALEVGLLAARLTSDAGDAEGARAHLSRVGDQLDAARGPDAVCYRVRWVGQRAFAFTRAGSDRWAEARGWFVDLPDDSGIPFVDYRRCAGIAYHTWRLGDVAGARAMAMQAAEHAGDGGFVRFRVMAFNLLARMSEGAEAEAHRRRAARLAASIEDAHLVAVSTR